MNIRSSEVISEIEEILKANPLIHFVSSLEGTVPLSQEVNQSAVYINVTNIVPKLTRQVPDISGYDFHGFFMLNVNVNSESKVAIFNLVDSIHRSLLDDQRVWLKITDRDILTTEFDNAEFYPLRSATLVLEVTYRLVC